MLPHLSSARRSSSEAGLRLVDRDLERYQPRDTHLFGFDPTVGEAGAYLFRSVPDSSPFGGIGSVNFHGVAV
jgi:hypothetical protein